MASSRRRLQDEPVQPATDGEMIFVGCLILALIIGLIYSYATAAS
jgi:hypothetical protein